MKDHCSDNQDNRLAVPVAQTRGRCTATEVRCSCCAAAVDSLLFAPPGAPGADVWMDTARSPGGEAACQGVAPADPEAFPFRPEGAAAAAEGIGPADNPAGAAGIPRCCTRPCIAVHPAASHRGLGDRSRREGIPAAPFWLRSAAGSRGILRVRPGAGDPRRAPSVHPGPSCCTSCEEGGPSAGDRTALLAAHPAVPPLPPPVGEARCPGPPSGRAGRWAVVAGLQDRWAAAGASMSSWLLLGCSLSQKPPLRPSVTWTARRTSIRWERGSADWPAAEGAHLTAAALGCRAEQARDHRMVFAAEKGEKMKM